jgi:hypothetical protein
VRLQNNTFRTASQSVRAHVEESNTSWKIPHRPPTHCIYRSNAAVRRKPDRELLRNTTLPTQKMRQKAFVFR